MSETRVLKSRGLYLFDTLNRTLQSKLVAIKVTQEWPLTRIVDTPLHDWQMFIKPAEWPARCTVTGYTSARSLASDHGQSCPRCSAVHQRQQGADHLR